MRSIVLANGELGAQIARWLAARGDLIGLVLHSPDAQRSTEALADELQVPSWSWPVEPEPIAELTPDCLVSVLFGHRLDARWLAIPSWQAINLHPGLLPHNAGSNPNVWPLVDGSPAGTTIHVMSPIVDAGDIIAQCPVATAADDTAYTLYQRLMAASRELFISTWPTITTVQPRPQASGGSRHRTSDLGSLDPQPEDLPLIDRLRAQTFPPYGAEFERDGRRWRIEVSITPVDQLDTRPSSKTSTTRDAPKPSTS